jgi:hypothetical protein
VNLQLTMSPLTMNLLKNRLNRSILINPMTTLSWMTRPSYC